MFFMSSFNSSQQPYRRSGPSPAFRHQPNDLSMVLPKIQDIMLTILNAKQFEDGDFDLVELVERFTGALADESRRSEILKMTGDNAALVTKCLDRVSGIRSRYRCRALTTPKVIFSDTFRANSDIQTRSMAFSTIPRLYRGCQYILRFYWIDPKTITLPEMRYASRTRAEVYLRTQNGEPVVVKVSRTSYQGSQTNVIKVNTGSMRGAQRAGPG